MSTCFLFLQALSISYINKFSVLANTSHIIHLKFSVFTSIFHFWLIFLLWQAQTSKFLSKQGKNWELAQIRTTKTPSTPQLEVCKVKERNSLDIMAPNGASKAAKEEKLKKVQLEDPSWWPYRQRTSWSKGWFSKQHRRIEEMVGSNLAI